MALSKERKLYISVMGLGLAALAADRLLVLDDGPAAASAADLLVTPAHRAEAAPPAPPPPSFPERLRERAQSTLAAQPKSPDAFLIPASWLPKPAQVQVEQAAPAQEQLSDRDAALFSLSSVAGSADRGFVAAVLNGTLVSKGDRFALREGKVVRVHQGAQGMYLLEEVSKDSVQLRVLSDDRVVTVQLKSDPAGNVFLETRQRQSR